VAGLMPGAPGQHGQARHLEAGLTSSYRRADVVAEVARNDSRLISVRISMILVGRAKQSAGVVVAKGKVFRW
jgi:hypothetical protein